MTRRRWIRALTPSAVVVTLLLVTAVAHVDQRINPRDPGTLSPAGTGPDGSSQLAELLTRRGVRIERVNSTDEAVAAAGTGPAVIFLPFPDLPVPSLVRRVAAVPGSHRVVALRPDFITQASWGVPVVATYQRWAATNVAPDCANRLAGTARSAAVFRTTYASQESATFARCFGGGLVGVHLGHAEVYVAGATDPFRNSRIGEHDNAALATALLSGLNRVIWVDIHSAEPRPQLDPQLSIPGYSRGDRQREHDSTLWTAFPTGLWAALVMLLIVAVLAALVRARRLGPPVPEPLPVTVPAAETVTGRGRLYHQAQARAAALATLRDAARSRLAHLIDPVVPPAGEALYAQVAQRYGGQVDRVREILADPAQDPPGKPARSGQATLTDAQLQQAVAELDALVDAVGHVGPPPDSGTRTVPEGDIP